MSNLDERIDKQVQEKYGDLVDGIEKRCSNMLTSSPTGEIREVMTLRDHFAGLAMSGMAHKFISQEGLLAEVSYEMVDAMLKQRNLTND